MISGPKKDYQRLIRAALEKADGAACEAAARDAFHDQTAGEDDLAWVAAMMYENEVHLAFDLLQTFVDRFPESLHLGRVYLADLLAQASHFDEATDQARFYLRLARDGGALPALAESPIIQDGVSRAVLLLTAAYTELGARSYSTRVLTWASRFALAPNWIEPIRLERQRLMSELKDPANRELDSTWERFFASGTDADALGQSCLKRGFQLMAKRLDLLEGNFRFNPRFKAGDDEMLMLVHASDASEYVLQ